MNDAIFVDEDTKWQGGRLVGTRFSENGKKYRFSYSTIEASRMSQFDVRIKMACANALNPYRPYAEIANNRIIKFEREEECER